MKICKNAFHKWGELHIAKQIGGYGPALFPYEQSYNAIFKGRTAFAGYPWPWRALFRLQPIWPL